MALAVTTDSPSALTPVSALLFGTLNNDNGESVVYVAFDWGLTTAYGNVIYDATIHHTGEDASATITGLLPGTTYHFRAHAWGILGDDAVGSDFSFSTPTDYPYLGIVPLTDQPTAVTNTSATLHGSLLDDGGQAPVSMWFEWGTSILYGSTTTPAGVVTADHLAASLSGLTPGQTYHYRAVAEGSGSVPYYGDDVSFVALAKVGYYNLAFVLDCTSLRNAFWLFGNNLFSSDQTWILPFTSIGGGVASVPIDGAALGISVMLAAPSGFDTIQVSLNGGTDTAIAWGAALTVGIYGKDTFASYDVLADLAGQMLYFASSPPVLTNSIRIIARYKVGNGSGTPKQSATSISTYGRTFARRVSSSDVNAVANLDQKANVLLMRYAYPLQKVTLTVDDTQFDPLNLFRFERGQTVLFHNSVLNTWAALRVYKVVYKIKGGGIRSYDLELRNYV